MLIQDADLEYDPDDWPRLLDPILKGKARVVYGSRFTGERKNMLPLHWFGNRLLSLVTNVLYSSTLSDMETCYKLFDAQVLDGLTIVSNRFDFEPEITAKVLRRGHRIYEVPISYAGREFDEGKKITWRDGVSALESADQVPLHQGVLRPRCRRRSAPSWSTTTRVRLLTACARSSTTARPGRRGGERRHRAASSAPCRRSGRRTRARSSVVRPGRTSATAPGSTGDWPCWPACRRRPTGCWCPTPTHRPPGALDGLRGALEAHPAWAVVGPRIYTDAGDVYPSVRRFPSFLDAAGHALLALFKPDNRFTRRYNPGTPEGERSSPAGWVSGSCFLARRDALEELGGFDEAYFMYTEDMDLCWRAHQAGWGVGFAGAAAVTHVQGVSTARHPYRMMAAHHRSALRFTVRTTSGWRRAALPFAVVVLGVRMAMALMRQAVAG